MMSSVNLKQEVKREFTLLELEHSIVSLPKKLQEGPSDIPYAEIHCLYHQKRSLIKIIGTLCVLRTNNFVFVRNTYCVPMCDYWHAIRIVYFIFVIFGSD